MKRKLAKMDEKSRVVMGNYGNGKKRGWVWRIVLVLAFCLLSVSGFDIDAWRVEFVARIGGSYSSVAIQGSYAYVGENGGLSILDVSDPADPQVVGMVALSPPPQHVVVSGNYAYVLVGLEGFHIIDISNPTNPTEVGYYETGATTLYGLAVRGDYAYIADRWTNTGLRIFDISNPSNPSEVGYSPFGGARDVAVQGNYAYVAMGYTYYRDDHVLLRVFDISNPSNPTQVGSYIASGRSLGASRVELNGNYAYVGVNNYEGDGGVEVVDISTPSNPTEVGRYVSYTSYTSYTGGVPLAASGNRLYVGDSRGLHIIDVSTPSNPTNVGTYAVPEGGGDFTVSGSYAYVVNGNALWVFDVSIATRPAEVGYYDTPGWARDITLSGNYAYVADGASGLRVINITTLSNPIQVGYYDTPGAANGVAVSGNYAYVADEGSGLRIIDISTPSNPTEMGFYNTPGNTMAVSVSGNYACIYDWGYGLRLIDVSTPSTPAEVAYFATPGSITERIWYASGVAMSGNYAYVADNYYGLRIIDITGSSSPTEFGSYATFGALDVVVRENYAYVGASGSGLRVIDISTPSNPTEVGFCDTPGNAQGVAVSGTHAYVANSDGAWSVYAGDLDADGDLDVLSASEFDDKIAWYENDELTSPIFTAHVITVDADGAVAVYAADLDGDGDLDVLSAAFWIDQIAWYENDGSTPPGFTAHVITEDPDGPGGLHEGFADGAIEVSAADVDGDGDLDVLSASRENNTIAWYENQGGIPPVFAPQTITTSAGGAWSVNVGDLDHDGDLDVVSAAYGDDTVAWYENLSPLQIVYDFLFDYDAWTTVSVPGFFSPPLFDWEGDPGYLKIISTVNTNCFGYWASPQNAIPSNSEYLYRAHFRISSDVTDQALVPQIRVRANSSNLQQYYVLSIESAGDGGSSPAVAGTDYDLFFVPPANARFASVAFDLLNFNPDDAAVAELALDNVIVERFALDSLSTPTVVQDYAFELNKNGWVSGGAPIVFSPPDYIYSGGALELRAMTNTNTFGFWVNDPADITIEADRLYRGIFEVRTDMTDPGQVPEMRLRLNAGNFQASHSFGISSAGDGANSPGITNTTYDRLYFLPPANCVGESLIVSFDMLNFSPDDAADASLILDRALIEALIPPTSP